MKTSANVRVDFEVNLVLNETEVMALDALVGYGFKPFVEAFYQKMGTSYLEPHVSGLETLFKKIEEMRPAMAVMKEVKKAAIEAKKKFATQ
jgi:hypothetical protein